MSKILPFKKPASIELKNMVEIGDIVDEAIIRGLVLEMEPTDILGVLAHRMGMLMKISPDMDFNEVLKFCNSTIKKKCGLKSS